MGHSKTKEKAWKEIGEIKPVDILYALNGSYGGISNMPNKVKKKTLEGDEQKETSTRGSTARYNERRSSNLANKKKIYFT